MIIIKPRRNTNQRIKILTYLKSVKTHPTAEQVYRVVKKDLPAITLATVYRNLNLLAEQGQILRLEINKEYRYDADKGYHQHCVCKKCSKIVDSFQKEISSSVLKRFQKKGFTPHTVEIIFYGICKECKNKIPGVAKNVTKSVRISLQS